VTLESLFARQTHVIVVMERIERDWSTKLDELVAQERKLRGIAGRLSETTMKLFAAKALAATMPTPVRIVSLFAGAAVGSFVSVWVWFALYAHTVFAAVK